MFRRIVPKNLLNSRFYHPGYYPLGASIALPMPPSSVECTYFSPVWGNGVQEKQLEKGTLGYNTNDIIKRVKQTKSFLEKMGNSVRYVPTSHGSSLFSAIASCPDLEEKTVYDFCKEMKFGGLSRTVNGKLMFINNEYTRRDTLTLIEKSDYSKLEKNVLKHAMLGVFSNFADSIYNANDYLLIYDSVNARYSSIVARYPPMVSQRNIERARVVATCLLNGICPLLVKCNFEGEANIKFFPSNSSHLEAIVYDSIRSDVRSVDTINKMLENRGLAPIKGHYIKVAKEYEKDFYHLDCALNFYKVGYVPLKGDTVIYVEKGLTDDSIEVLKRFFKHLIPVDANEDPLIANMIVTKEGVVGTSKISKEKIDAIKEAGKDYLGYEHPSRGGGGAHKCCSNIINRDIKKRDLEEWVKIMKTEKTEYEYELKDHFKEAVKEEIERIKDFYRHSFETISRKEMNRFEDLYRC